MLQRNALASFALNEKTYWYYLIALMVLAALLRFWNLGGIPGLVFDEVYFSKYAHNFLTGTEYFDTHPPLSKYLIAIGIWLHNHLPWNGDPSLYEVEITELSAWSWRWLNAVAGVVVVAVVARLAWYLFPSLSLSLVLAFFVATDGGFLVESRFGLNNIYLVGFGACGLMFLAKHFREAQAPRAWTLILAGLFLGLSYSIKWNGLGFSLAAWMLVFPLVLLLWLNRIWAHPLLQLNAHFPKHPVLPYPLWIYLLCLVAIPALVYCVLWQPHLWVYEKFGFFDMQKQIFGYHSGPVGIDEHPYCSTWNQWPFILRPVGYYFFSEKGGPNPYFVDVHHFGNPVLFWLAALAMAAITVHLLINALLWYRYGTRSSGLLYQALVVAGFAANWLPWTLVTRCLYQYHFMAASLFAFMALAWYVALSLRAPRWYWRLPGIAALLLIAAGVVYWLPIQLGIPISPESFYNRMWLRSWI